MHTTASDGKNTIEEMGAAARDLGYDYIALTDHSKAVTVANGMDDKRTLEHMKKIRAAQKRVDGIRLLAGIEVDILKNGALDLADETLAQLDVVVASVHSYMNLDRSEMTDRLLRAIENPYTQILAHPTGRLLLRREPFEYDMEKILDAAKKHGVIVETNAYPDRLDLKDIHLRQAKKKGVKVVISTDSHSTINLNYMKYGVTTARRGWLEKSDVANTLPLASFPGGLTPKARSQGRLGPGSVMTQAFLAGPANPKAHPQDGCATLQYPTNHGTFSPRPSFLITKVEDTHMLNSCSRQPKLNWQSLSTSPRARAPRAARSNAVAAKLLCVAAVALTALAAGSPASAGQWTKKYTVTVGRPSTWPPTTATSLSLPGPSGEIQADVHADGYSIPGDVHVSESQVGDAVRLDIKVPSMHFHLFGGSRTSVGITVHVPSVRT